MLHNLILSLCAPILFSFFFNDMILSLCAQWQLEELQNMKMSTHKDSADGDKAKNGL